MDAVVDVARCYYAIPEWWTQCSSTYGTQNARLNPKTSRRERERESISVARMTALCAVVAFICHFDWCHAMAASCWSVSIEWLDAANVESDSPSPYLSIRVRVCTCERWNGAENIIFISTATDWLPSIRPNIHSVGQICEPFFIVTTFILSSCILPILSFVDDSSSSSSDSDSLQHSRISMFMCKHYITIESWSERGVVLFRWHLTLLQCPFRVTFGCSTHILSLAQPTTRYRRCFRVCGRWLGAVARIAPNPNQSHSPLCMHLHQITAHVRRVHHSLLKHFPNAAPRLCGRVCVCVCVARLHRWVDVENLECVTSWL